jgi:hypothetical protein
MTSATIMFGWDQGAVTGRCQELRVFDEARGVMEFRGALNLPHGRALPLPFKYMASDGWAYAMLDAVEQSLVVHGGEGDGDGGFDDELGHIVLFPTYDVRATFRSISIDQYDLECRRSEASF